MSSGQATERMKTLVGKLGQYANTHLQTEERLLKLNNYRGFAEHKAEHDAYVTKMRNFEKDMNSGKKTVSIELLSFLREWWTGHILNSDQKYSELLKSRNVN
jgi:hemerythrin-like metal-binding protein